MINKNIAKVPPKGWNSWDAYGASVTEDEVRRNAEFMSKYLKQYGWEYIVVDIQWYEPTANSSTYHNFTPLLMDDYSRLIPDEKRFPSAKDGQGFKPLADYVHSLGLKFGIHIMRGIPRQAAQKATPIKGTNKTARDIALNNICPWNADMYGVNMAIPEGQLYYDSLMDLYASWGVDFVKCDDIASSKLYNDKSWRPEIQGLHRAIMHSGRDMVLSLSPGPAQIEDGALLQNNANMWRVTDDFWDDWSLLLDMFDRAEKWAPLSKQGNWPDFDMLPLGHIGIRSVDGPGGDRQTRFTKSEQRMLMSLWCLGQSPLIMGGELTDMDDWTTKLLTNQTLLYMNDYIQEKRQVYRDDNQIIWYAATEKNEYIAVFNISDKEILLNPNDLPDVVVPTKGYSIWDDQDIDITDYALSSHDVCLIQV